MFVDPHTHFFLCNYSTLELIKKENYSEIYILAYLPFKPHYYTTLVDLFRWLLDIEPARFNELGLNAHIGVGIHPRNIPSSGISTLLSSIDEYLVRAEIVGEIGLELGTEEEVNVLKDLLVVADRFDKPVIIHTPRKGKEIVLKKLVNILGEGRVQSGRVVVDHASYELINEFLKLKTFIGLTIQPGKLSVNELVKLVKNYPELVEVGMVNSDCGRDPSDPLAVKLAYEGMITNEIGNSDAIKLVRDNALRFIRRS
ncbi:MAG: TatD family hydrolase [Sulfolobales archaeon]